MAITTLKFNLLTVAKLNEMVGIINTLSGGDPTAMYNQYYDLDGRYDTMATDVVTYDNTYDALNVDLTTLQGSLPTAITNFGTLQSSVGTLSGNTATQIGLLDAIESITSTWTAEISQFNTDYNADNSNTTTLEGQMDQAQIDIAYIEANQGGGAAYALSADVVKTVKSSGGDYTTLQAALDWAMHVYPNGYKITINVLENVDSLQTSVIVLDNVDLDYVTIYYPLGYTKSQGLLRTANFQISVDGLTLYTLFHIKGGVAPHIYVNDSYYINTGSNSNNDNPAIVFSEGAIYNGSDLAFGNSTDGLRKFRASELCPIVYATQGSRVNMFSMQTLFSKTSIWCTKGAYVNANLFSGGTTGGTPIICTKGGKVDANNASIVGNITVTGGIININGASSSALVTSSQGGFTRAYGTSITSNLTLNKVASGGSCFKQ